MSSRVRWIAALLLAAACEDRSPAPDAESAPAVANPPPKSDSAAKRSPEPPHEALNIALLRTHTRALSEDTMEGRRPGTPGGTLAVQYIVTAMRDLGLEPSGDKDGFTQAVRMRSVRTDPDKTALIAIGMRGKPTQLPFGTAFVGSTYGEAGEHRIDAPLVFAGYGVTAPEYDWDDYAGLDPKGKIVVVFVGDPPVGDDRFGGDAMTYYGRWTYKFERALEAGALGCLVIHEDEPASYGWNVVQNSWSGDRFHLLNEGGALPAALSIQGWISREAAQAVAKRAGASLDDWHARALAPNFRAVDTGSRVAGKLTTTEKRTRDVNVIGRIPGASRPDEAVVITAHWDHLGVKRDAVKGEDAIFNGAVDNSSGIAGMLGVATGIRASVASGRPPQRTVLFVATTAEEQGLLGSKHFAAHPSTTAALVAVVNLDSMNVHGRTKTIQVIGPGQSTLEDVLAEVAAGQGRRIVPDEHPGSGGYYRSDHFSFAKHGVPAIYFRGGTDMEEGGLEAGRALADTKSKRYHTVADEYDPNWSFGGAEQDAEAVMDLVMRVANTDAPPTWKPTSEFAKIKR